ncbi:unnamed protein product [Leptidea sinapis]|uniref:Uncharacterized protein n=1 Tax=Leptidea sinapis TaxID=189913 RepID=A0A5E4QTE7_9NEOP|nr:unnamed protein product [Leptidea sinapis]
MSCTATCRILADRWKADPLPGKHVPLESYESELEREHALPTSVPNADILKTNSNPTYHKPSHIENGFIVFIRCDYEIAERLERYFN